MHFNGDLCFMRYGNQGDIQRVALCNGTIITSGDFELKLREGAGFVEVNIDGTEAIIEAGSRGNIISIKGDTGEIILK